MHLKLLDPDHLAHGTERQKQAHTALKNIALFDRLKAHSPVLSGTIPLDIDLPSSELAVICSAENLETFADELRSHFGSEEGFSLGHQMVRGQPSVIARFRAYEIPFMVFAQPVSVFVQPEVLHMLVEARLLSFAPNEAREAVRDLKRSGLSTETAFAELFDLEGDPNKELLEISRLTDREILQIAHRFFWKQ